MPQVRVAALAALCLLLSGCSGGEKAAAPPPDPAPTSVRQLDASGMKVVRVAFCDLVPATAVRSALGSSSVGSRSWRSGNRLRAAGNEIGAEFGCAWSGRSGRAARAWVFATPISVTLARSLVRAAGRERGCSTSSRPAFGTPSVVQTCVRKGTPRRIRYAGLFGGSWLTCEVAGPGTRTALAQRADRWCATVANVLDAG